MIQDVMLGGETRSLKFGFNTMALFGDLTGKKLSEMQNIASGMSMSDIIKLMWCGLKEGARKAGKEFDHTYDEVGDWLDDLQENDPDGLAGMMAMFNQSQAPVQNGKKKVKGKR
jgi:hypothetical protein